MKKNVYTYISESLCCTAEINTVNQLYFNKINFEKDWSRKVCSI